MQIETTRPTLTIPVYLSATFRVVHGVNEGDALSFANELVPDDIYWFTPTLKQKRLIVHPGAYGQGELAQSTEIGQPGATLHLDSYLTFMSPDGSTTELLVLVEVASDGTVNEVYALPLSTPVPRTDYQLVGVDRDNAPTKMAEVTCVSFTEGTQITMANGMQRAIQDLRIGDRILTRDNGPQELRWIGHSTIRAVGAFAPIVIRAGELANTNDLVVSPNHRLFIYQREDTLGIGRKEMLVRARHLVNGTTIYQMDGGFVEYYQLLFDNHEIIYAEGIAAETMLLNAAAQATLMPDLDENFSGILPGQSDEHMLDLEVKHSDLKRPDALELLRKATNRVGRHDS
ncbi:Hint domain-containing protein [Pseudooceanicola sp. HF7]|uniref:Hint domain-containing protein n=1 Tax=Pseudooceanicola sp. HF7 TaxID=2721560 RepID=UPI001431B34E|nr:Hint domain-containing protein [Pseudooceanicola sp. HF7]NIZ09226.1 Hint domain-containing protein [Pseudooceanicola sp. HF7]